MTTCTTALRAACRSTLRSILPLLFMAMGLGGCDLLPIADNPEEPCEVGAFSIAPDGCNVCECMPDGSLACTERACPEPMCEEGEQRQADDGCNTCTCEADGSWSCTEMACLCPEEPEVRYMGQGEACDEIDFACEPHEEHFYIDGCGCGCRPLPNICACPEIWAPVCGDDGQTYGNQCEAECAQAPVAHDGECVDGCLDEAHPNVTYHSRNQDICMQDDWACGGAARMFFNDCGCGCIANDPSVCADDEALHEGRCARLCGADGGCPENEACGGCVPDPACPECDVCLEICMPAPPPPPPVEECVCIEIYEPVCGADGQTYGNSCYAECERVDIAYEGECR